LKSRQKDTIYCQSATEMAGSVAGRIKAKKFGIVARREMVETNVFCAYDKKPECGRFKN